MGLRVKNLVGISYPFRKEAGEFPRKALNAELIKNDLLTLFRTPIRSRVMRPNFGTIIDRLIMEPIDAILLVRLERAVRQAVLLHEPRVTILSVTFSVDGTAVTIDIAYDILGQRDEMSLEFDQAA